MVFKRQLHLNLSDADIDFLTNLIGERKQLLHTIKHAQILLDHFNGMPTNSIAKNYDISRKTVENLVKKTNRLGVKNVLLNTKRPGRPKFFAFSNDPHTFLIASIGISVAPICCVIAPDSLDATAVPLI